MPVSKYAWRTTSVLIAVFSAVLLGSAAPAQEASQFRRGWEAGSPATRTGELMIQVVDDFETKRSERIHTLRDEETGMTIRLRFEAAAPQQLRSGSRVTVHGRATGQEIYLAAADGSITQEPDSSSLSATGVVTGDQKTLVIVTHFQDKQVNPMMPGGDCSIQAISDRMFTHPQDLSVDDMYRESSLGQVSFTGTVAGPYTISVSSTDPCDTLVWANAADAAATAGGYDTSMYARKVYVMPSNSCPAAGIAEFGVTPSRAWVFTCDRPRVYAHELGHNLGMHHAADLESEYGDGSDVMGLADGLASFNAPHKTQMAWLPEAQTSLISLDGVYDVAPLAQDPSTAGASQILKVAIPGSSEHYYLSYRHGGGFEINACCSYLDRLSVHRWAGGSQKTYLVASLADGATFNDTASGFTVTQLSHSDASASVHVQIGSGCGRQAPGTLLTPPDQSGGPATTRAYDLSLTNNDGSGCPASTFALSGATPPGWTGSWSVSSLQLAPGATGVARWSVTSPTTALSGTYGLTAYASDTADAIHSASANGTYSVMAGDTFPPTAPENLSAKIKGRQVNLSWQAAADNVGVTYYRVWRDGVGLGNVTGTSWTDVGVVSGMAYTYFVTAHDAAGNSSEPSSSVLVRLSGGGRGK